MIAFELQSDASHDAVLAALRSGADASVAARIPSELRRHGITAVECRVDESTCTLTYRRSWPAPGSELLRARSTVVSAGDGSRVAVVVEHDAEDFTLLIVGFAVSTLIGYFLVGWTAILTPLLPLTVVLVDHMASRAVNRTLARADNLAADFLARCVEQAVAGAEDAQGARVASVTLPRASNRAGNRARLAERVPLSHAITLSRCMPRHKSGDHAGHSCSQPRSG